VGDVFLRLWQAQVLGGRAALSDRHRPCSTRLRPSSDGRTRGATGASFRNWRPPLETNPCACRKRRFWRRRAGLPKPLARSQYRHPSVLAGARAGPWGGKRRPGQSGAPSGPWLPVSSLHVLALVNSSLSTDRRGPDGSAPWAPRPHDARTGPVILALPERLAESHARGAPDASSTHRPRSEPPAARQTSSDSPGRSRSCNARVRSSPEVRSRNRPYLGSLAFC
jgi:hypothetical protein